MMWRVLVYVTALCVCLRLAAGECSITGDSGVSYKEDVLAADVDFVFGLAVNLRTNTLYYNFKSLRLQKRVSVAFNLQRRTHNIIAGLSGRCAHTVDQRQGVIYAGCLNDEGHGGLYKLDSRLRQFQLIGAEGEDVNFVHFTNRLYYSSKYSFRLHTYANGRTYAIPQLADSEVWGLVVDGAGGWVYYNMTAAYRMTPATGALVQYAGTEGTEAIAVSPRGVVYTCDYYASMIFRTDMTTLSREVAAPSCGSMTFDARGDIIYGDWATGKIVRFIRC